MCGMLWVCVLLFGYNVLCWCDYGVYAFEKKYWVCSSERTEKKLWRNRCLYYALCSNLFSLFCNVSYFLGCSVRPEFLHSVGVFLGNFYYFHYDSILKFVYLIVFCQFFFSFSPPSWLLCYARCLSNNNFFSRCFCVFSLMVFQLLSRSGRCKKNCWETILRYINFGF